jgi:hypothetical protein
MASSSNNLQNSIQKKYDSVDSSSNAFDLPSNQNTVIKLLSGPKEMPYKQLCATMETLPEDERLTQPQLDGTLYELIRMSYLTSFMENGDVVYMLQVDVGKKPPPQRHEQRLLRKLDLGALNLDELRKSKKGDTKP